MNRETENHTANVTSSGRSFHMLLPETIVCYIYQLTVNAFEQYEHH